MRERKNENRERGKRKEERGARNERNMRKRKEKKGGEGLPYRTILSGVYASGALAEAGENRREMRLMPQPFESHS